MTDIERMRIAVLEADKLWKLYQLRRQILRDRMKGGDNGTTLR